MKTIEQFCGQKNGYSRSITLRNRLIPVGKTEENLQKANMLEADFERAKAYSEVKNLIDDFHRSFIEYVLSNAKLDWKELYNNFDLYQSEKDKTKKEKQKKDLQSVQVAMRKAIVKKFKDDERFSKLFKKELLSDLLPSIIKDDESGTEALKVFKGFSTYFSGFHQNRENLYSDEAKATAISNRIVNENFPKFYANVKVFEYLQKNFPEIISDTEESLKEFLNGKKLSEIFNPESFNAVLCQSGIDFYNTVIGGISDENGKQKIQGLNEKINLASQQLPPEEKSKLKKKMTVLYKQILSDKKTASFIPIGFGKSEEVYKSIKQFKEEYFDKAYKLIEKTFSAHDYELSEIFVPAKELTAFSFAIFGNWSILNDGLFLLEKDNSKKELTEKQVENLHKEISKKDYSLTDLQCAYERWANENGVPADKTVKSYFSLSELRANEKTKEKELVDIIEKIKTAYEKIDFENIENLQAEKEAATPIKNFLDEVQCLFHHLKLVDYRGEEQKDSAFYSKLDEILIPLSEIIPLYNKVRNFVTKKPGEVKKIKLNFECPTLAGGWALNNEIMYGCILLRKENKYFLGIMNKDSHNSFKKYPEPKNGESYFEKMIYLQAADPSKDIPNLLVIDGKTVKKNGRKDPDGVNRQIEKLRNDYLPTEINEIRKRKSYLRTSETFCKDDLVKYIDYYKQRTIEYFNSYKFLFKKSSEYYSFANFTDDVNNQAYQIQFTKVSENYIDSLVDSGKLYLFQIYNKDFAEKADGKKNLHTLYWENLFSPENLKDICLKLNGEAELFYRPASENLKIIKHEKDSILVNRTTTDGETIRDEIYQEIYKFKNPAKQEKGFKLSDEAKSLLDSGKVVLKKARFEITKDKHFLQNTYLFHCPITMNFKAPEITGKKFNERVLEYLRNNPDVKIIGLDRGERHLIYLSLINQNGEIELQKTLNIVEQIRGDKENPVAVNYQEKLVQKEGDRDKARKNWQTIGNIKELKEGYLSNIVHEIAKLMVEQNAIVVMEDLNFGFKRGRFAVERQVYQKFENMLIEKLNYFAFKDKAVTEPGGILNAYQLTDKSANVSDVGKQCGWIFYIPASYTSKIDPKTGFANLFNTKGLTNVEFFSKFDSIRYDSKENCFVFTVNYSKLGDSADFRKNWEIYTHGERIVYSRKENKTFSVNPTENLEKAFDDQFSQSGINWKNKENLIDLIENISAEKSNAKFFDELLRSFTTTLQMRNSVPNTEEDYLISPVKAADGTFFDSRNEIAKGKDSSGKWISKFPVDADANGAYHIALKGLYLLQNNFNLNEKGYIENISNADWFKFVQKKEYLK